MITKTTKSNDLRLKIERYNDKEMLYFQLNQNSDNSVIMLGEKGAENELDLNSIYAIDYQTINDLYKDLLILSKVFEKYKSGLSYDKALLDDDMFKRLNDYGVNIYLCEQTTKNKDSKTLSKSSEDKTDENKTNCLTDFQVALVTVILKKLKNNKAMIAPKEIKEYLPDKSLQDVKDLCKSDETYFFLKRFFSLAKEGKSTYGYQNALITFTPIQGHYKVEINEIELKYYKCSI